MTVVATSDDVQLVAGLRNGDEQAFAQLVELYHSRLLRLARVYVNDGATAEDVVQDTWMGLLRGLDSFRGQASIKTWLFRILVNRARTRAVREKRTVPFSALASQEIDSFETSVDPARFRPADDPHWPGHWLLAPSDEDLPEQRLLASELTERVHAAVDALPPAQREVVTLRDIDGCSSDEVCQLLDLSEVNQRVLLHRGRSKVRLALEEYVTRAHRAAVAV